MRPDSTVNYLGLRKDINRRPPPTPNPSLGRRWPGLLDGRAPLPPPPEIKFPRDNTSRLNILGVLDGLTSDLTEVTSLILKNITTTASEPVPTSTFIAWNGTELGYVVSYNASTQWHDTFLAPANRTLLNCFIGIRDAIQ